MNKFTHNSIYTTFFSLIWQDLPRELKSIIQQIHRNPELSLLFFILVIFYIYIKLQTRATPELNNPLKRKAMYPDVDSSLLFKKPPNGIIFGAYKKQYVCKPLSMDGAVLCIGGSGSGKSSCMAIPSLMSCHSSLFAIDIKGELVLKSSIIDDENTFVFNPLDESAYGYDPLYKLNINGSYSEQSLYETMETIVFSLVPLEKDSKSNFWTSNARLLLLGLFIYFYKQGFTNIVSICDEILSKPLQTLLEKIKEDIDSTAIENRLLSTFYDLAETTMSCITNEAELRLRIFSVDQNIRQSFLNNPKKINPTMLEKGNKRIFITIPEHKLDSYSTILQLIVNQFLNELIKRPEDSEPILFMIDELPRILSSGKLESLLNGLRTLRSRKVTLCLITQSLEALACAYTSNEIEDIVTNCPYILVLSASSHNTIRSIVEWCGKYIAPKYSENGTGVDARTSISYTEENIVCADDLRKLSGTEDVILISPYGYNRFSKIRYYKHPFFKKIYQRIKSNNLEADRRFHSLFSEKQANLTSKPIVDLGDKLSTNDSLQLLEWEESLIPETDLELLKQNNETLDFHST